jgi:hypothetical protein
VKISAKASGKKIASQGQKHRLTLEQLATAWYYDSHLHHFPESIAAMGAFPRVFVMIEALILNSKGYLLSFESQYFLRWHLV